MNDQTTLTIDEVRALHEDIENRIYALLNDFCKKTGTRVIAIDVDSMAMQQIGARRASVEMTFVKVKVEL